MSDCIFCGIVAGMVEASVVYRDERVCAFVDIRPVNAGHVLVVPVAHATALADLPSEDGAQMMRIAQRLAAGLRLAQDAPWRCEGVNLHLADGAVAGQEVLHVHLHVLPRYAGDGFGLRLPRGYGQMAPRAELDRVAAAMRAALP
jgi:diadenosine tetraphosphate (Ap4A) HIT family hydrolase